MEETSELDFNVMVISQAVLLKGWILNVMTFCASQKSFSFDQYCALQVSQQGFKSVKESGSKQFHMYKKRDLCGDSQERRFHAEKSTVTLQHAPDVSQDFSH